MIGHPTIPSSEICVTIPVFNQLHFTTECVGTLNRAGVTDEQIVIVNNASTDGTRDFLATRPALRAIHNDHNRGCAQAWSQGSKASRATWTVVANNDVVFAPDTFSRLIKFAEENCVDVASPGVCEGTADYNFLPYASDYMQRMAGVTRWDVAYGCCFMIHRRVFDKIGYFDDDPRLGGYEDDEFFRRSRAHGFRLAINGSSFFHHYGGTTQKSIKASLNRPNMSLGDRTYYRQKTGQTWPKRKATHLRNAVRNFWWRTTEKARFGHTLHEKRIDGQWHYC